MTFSTLQDGIVFYQRYAHLAGFQTRLGSSKVLHGVITHKTVLCNRAGTGNPVGTKRKRKVTKAKCNAFVRFKRVGNGHYCISKFVEGHSHILATPNTMVHLTSSRKLNVLQKKMIWDNSKVNIGPVKTFRMFKEYCQGYGKIGASLQDFKNFSRDIKKFIKEADAQMLIESFVAKKAKTPSFYFDFDMDENSRLTRIFWADPVMIRNYKMYGSSISFDTTFSKNQYRLVFAPFTGVDNHGSCVTFAAGLIAQETSESFAWLFDNFIKAMEGKYPDSIITDQDLGIKGGVEMVFKDKTVHRYCIWHIMRKLNDKVGSQVCRETDFLKDINDVVWGDDVDPNYFEIEWPLIIERYKLQNNEWLKQIYEMRTSWVPAYFRDFPLNGIMRTTSRSESVNSFISTFTNPRLSLVEFYMRFESAMDAQRWKQADLNAQCKTSSPKLSTPTSIESHASEFYTHNAFYEFQTEVEMAFYNCGLGFKERQGNKEHLFINEHKKNRTYAVEITNESDDKSFICSCKKWEGYGILCCHIIYAMKERGFQEIPSKYLMDRWGKAGYIIEDDLMRDCASFSSKKNKVGELWSEIYTCVNLVENDTEGSDKLLDLLREFKEKLVINSEKGKGKMDEMEEMMGARIPTEINVKPPSVAKNKGSGRRIQSEKEKAIKKKERPLRQCKFCFKMVNHDIRNCPKKKALRETELAADSDASSGNEDNDEPCYSTHEQRDFPTTDKPNDEPTYEKAIKKKERALRHCNFCLKMVNHDSRNCPEKKALREVELATDSDASSGNADNDEPCDSTHEQSDSPTDQQSDEPTYPHGTQQITRRVTRSSIRKSL